LRSPKRAEGEEIVPVWMLVNKILWQGIRLLELVGSVDRVKKFNFLGDRADNFATVCNNTRSPSGLSRLF
jgi:hypothetical protein